jgi:hypothetical protein
MIEVIDVEVNVEYYWLVQVRWTFASLKKESIRGLWKILSLYRRVVAQYVALAAKQVSFIQGLDTEWRLFKESSFNQAFLKYITRREVVVHNTNQMRYLIWYWSSSYTVEKGKELVLWRRGVNDVIPVPHIVAWVHSDKHDSYLLS